MDKLFYQIEFDDSVRCVVLTGAGDYFMAGGDVKNMHAYRLDVSELLRQPCKTIRAMSRLNRLNS